MDITLKSVSFLVSFFILNEILSVSPHLLYVDVSVVMRLIWGMLLVYRLLFLS